MQFSKSFLTCCAVGILSARNMAMDAGAAAPDATPHSRRWTTSAIVEAPQLVQTAISVDGNIALYVVRRDHVDGNSRDSGLFEVDLRSRQTRQILRARWITNVAAVPGSTDWSMLVDLGNGVQLYRLGPGDKITPQLISESLVTIGTDQASAIAQSAYEEDQAFGVLDYGWSPDGRACWYTTARQIQIPPSEVAVIESPTTPYFAFRPSVSELRVVDDKGMHRLVASAVNDSSTVYGIVFSADAATWEAPSGRSRTAGLTYRTPEVGADGVRRMAQRYYDLATGVSTPIRAEPEPTLAQRFTYTDTTIVGPNGGVVRVKGSWGHQRLIEVMPNRQELDFGPVDFTLNTYWSRGAWAFPRDASAVVGVRHGGLNVRSNLIKLTRNGHASELEHAVSLHHCALSVAAERGICIREGINVPPTVVSVDVRNWTQTPVAQIDSRYDSIVPLKVEPRVWKTGDLEASGFVVYPRGYDARRRYPAIVLTHGNDADNSFVYWDFQWSYPAQVWAERGYVVIYINDIPATQSDERLRANMQWVAGAGDLPGTRVQDIAWLDDVAIYKQVIASLSAQEIIDPAHLGIAGYSRGSQMVNVAITQTDLFKAASSGEGSYFAPSSYWTGDNSRTYGMLFGGPPDDAQAAPGWQRLSPTLRAKGVKAAVLFQVSINFTGKVDFYRALRAAHVPAEFVLFSRETHILHKPWNRLTAMEQNLDWFDFWLKGVEDSDPAKSAQYRRWAALRDRPALSE